MKRIATLLVIIFLLLSGCTFHVSSISNQSSDTDADIEEIGSEGLVDSISSSHAAFGRIDQIDVHANPGGLFSSVAQINKGDEITILSKAPGDEWLFVELPDGSTGWVFSFLVQTDIDLSEVPIQKPDEVQVISGQLRTENGEPIDGVQFSIVQSSSSGELQNNATTDENGNFIVFMPLDAAGEWTVSYAAISCTSIVYDLNCELRPEYAGTVVPESQIVTLPDAQLLDFTWK